MIINGVELECDILDVTTLKAIKQGSERVANINKEIAPIQDEIEQIEAMCHIIFDFFNHIFGEGTSEKLFGDKVSLTLCMDAFESLMKQKAEQEEAFNKRAEKYKGNRSQRLPGSGR